MEILFEENKADEIHLSDKEIFTKIWMSPRQVFKFIDEKGYTKFSTILLILGGITSALNSASTRSMGDIMPLWSVLIVCMIGGGVFGWLYFYIYAALLSWTGKWLKGTGNTKSLFRMISYALIPSLLVLFTFILRIVLIGNDEFQRNVDVLDNEFLITTLFSFSLFVEIVTGIWTLVVLVIGISEVQKLSIGKSIVNLILPGVLLIIVCIPVAAIAFLAGDFLK